MTHRRWMFATLFAASLAVTGCGEASPPSEAGAPSQAAPPRLNKAPVQGETLATVNGMAIGSDEFDQIASRKARGDALDEATRNEIMEQLVADKLLYQAALAQGIDQDPKIQKMMVNTLLKQDVYSSVKTSDITEEDLQAYFEAHKDEFVVPEKAQVKRIVVEPEGADPTSAPPEAWEAARVKVLALRERLQERKSDFRQVAQEESAGAYARRGGDLGFVTREGKPGIPQEVIDMAFTLEKGALSEPFRTERGWNLVYVPNRRERVERTFDQMRGSVLRKVKSDTYKDLYESYVANLRSGAEVQIDTARLGAHKVNTSRGPMLEAPGDEPDAVEPDSEE